MDEDVVFLKLKVTPDQALKIDAAQFVYEIEKALGTEASKDDTWTSVLLFLKSMRQASSILLDKLRHSTKERLGGIPIITYPSGEFNAWIAKPPSEKGLYIYFDTRFYRNLVYFLDLNFASDFGQDEVWKRVFILLMDSAFGLGYPREDAVCLPEHVGAQHTHVRLIFFILAHEYSHFLLGHLANTGSFINRDLKFSDQSVYSSSQKEELEADKKAIDLLKEAYLGQEAALFNILLGCATFFTYVNAVKFLVDYTMRLKGNRPDDTLARHPGPMDRLKRIEKHIKHIMPKHVWIERANDIRITMNDLAVLKKRYASKHAKSYLQALAINYVRNESAFREGTKKGWKWEKIIEKRERSL